MDPKSVQLRRAGLSLPCQPARFFSSFQMACETPPGVLVTKITLELSQDRRRP